MCVCVCVTKALTIVVAHANDTNSLFIRSHTLRLIFYEILFLGIKINVSRSLNDVSDVMCCVMAAKSYL